MENNNLLRDGNLRLIFLNKSDYEKSYLPFIKKFNLKSFKAYLELIKQKINDIKVSQPLSDTISFLYERDIMWSLVMIKEDYIPKYEVIDSEILLNEEIGIDIMLPMLFFLSEAYSKNSFFTYLFYPIPIQYSRPFRKLAMPEINKLESQFVEFIDFFSPYIDMAELQLSHFLLSKELLIQIKNTLEIENDKIKMNEIEIIHFNFLIRALGDGIKGETMVILQERP
jgi:hypothetical protein